MQLSEATRNLAEKENEIMEEQRALRNERKLEAEKENEDEEYKRLLGLLKTYLDDKEWCWMPEWDEIIKIRTTNALIHRLFYTLFPYVLNIPSSFFDQIYVHVFINIK